MARVCKPGGAVVFTHRVSLWDSDERGCRTAAEQAPARQLRQFFDNFRPFFGPFLSRFSVPPHPTRVTCSTYPCSSNDDLRALEILRRPIYSSCLGVDSHLQGWTCVRVGEPEAYVKYAAHGQAIHTSCWPDPSLMTSRPGPMFVSWLGRLGDCAGSGSRLWWSLVPSLPLYLSTTHHLTITGTCRLTQTRLRAPSGCGSSRTGLRDF